MQRVVLLGLDNPRTDDPHFALFPRPAGSAGHRLLLLIQEVSPNFSETDYLRLFDRRNLGRHPVPKHPEGRARLWLNLEREFSGRRVVALGSAVRDASGLNGTTPIGEFLRTPRGLVELAWLPHPSGMNRWYNSRENRAAAGKFLSSLVRRV